MASLVEQCQIHPSESPLPHNHNLSIPLTHFDVPFLQSDPSERLIFYNIPSSKSHFMNTIVPKLKRSLSLTLHHFLPLAGKIMLPVNSGKPSICYTLGDSVSLTIAVCDKNIDTFSGKHQRDADELYTCLPHLPSFTFSCNELRVPVMALRITLFPEQGFCIGLINHHVVGDECSIVNFVKSWALVNQSGQITADVPFYDRELVNDPERFFMAWNLVQKSRPFSLECSPHIRFPLNKVRSTFIITASDVESLKRWLVTRKPSVSHVSSFTVICAYIWVCSEKAAVASGEKVDYDETVYFPFAADCRTRLSPRLPSTYFGNCVVFVIAQSEHGKLIGNEGLIVATEAIGNEIKKTVYDKKNILECADWPIDFAKYSGKRLISVAGSPRFDIYNADFGFGKPSKYEFVHLNMERSVSLIRSREYEGGFEVGLSRKEIEMNAFEEFFTGGLEKMKVLV